MDTGIPGYVAQVPWTILGHPGQQLGNSPHHQSLSLALAEVSHQTLSAGRLLHGRASFWIIGMKGEIVCFASWQSAGLKEAAVVETE